MFSFNLFATTPAKSTDNKYLREALKVHQEQATDALLDPSIVLLKLMQLYYNTAMDSLFYIVPTSISGLRHHHTNHAEDCITRLSQPSNIGPESAIYYLNDINDIDPNGDFALLLSTFFSLYPSYLRLCNADLLNQLRSVNLWTQVFEEWAVTTYPDNLQIFAKHEERYEQLAAVIPKSLADHYAAHLLTLLDNKQTKELQLGWIYLAIAKISSKVSAATHAKINEKINHSLSLHPSDSSIIGLSHCVISLPQAGDVLYKMGEALCHYILNHPDTVRQLFDTEILYFYDDSAYLHDLYAERLFSALDLYQLSLNSAQKNSIIFFMLQKDNIFLLRAGFKTLRYWFTPFQLEELEEKISHHSESEKLLVMFWPWLSNPDYRRAIFSAERPIPKQLQALFDTCQKKALKELTVDISDDAPLREHVLALFATHSYHLIPDTFIAHLLHRLNTLIAEKNNDDREDNLVNLYEAVSLFNQSQRFTNGKMEELAIRILNSTRGAGDSKIDGIHAALSIHQNFSSKDRQYIRASLLQAIKTQSDTDRSSIPGDALLLYAKQAPEEEIEATLTALAAMPAFTAKCLLRRVHAIYQIAQMRVESGNHSRKI